MPPGPSSGSVTLAIENLETNGHTDLVRALLTDLYVKSPGWKVTPAVESDLARIRSVDPSDGAILSTWAHDHTSVASYFFSNSNLQQTLQQIGSTIGGIAGTIGTLPSNALGPITGGLSQTAQDTGVTSVAGFLSILSQKNTWLRVLEGLVGLVFLGIGVAAVTKDTGAAKYVGKAVKYIK